MIYRVCINYFDVSKLKHVDREYLVHAFSITEAEAKTLKYTDEMKTEKEVTSAKKTDDVEVIEPVEELRNEGKWYNICYTKSDDGGKKSRAKMMICELSTAEAERKFKEIMKDSVFEYEVKKIEETKIYDLI